MEYSARSDHTPPHIRRSEGWHVLIGGGGIVDKILLVLVKLKKKTTFVISIPERIPLVGIPSSSINGVKR